MEVVVADVAHLVHRHAELGGDALARLVGWVLRGGELKVEPQEQNGLFQVGSVFDHFNTNESKPASR